ncbi:lantibiotic dehydratase family protein (plasmid) [Streptomyces sp. NBC_01216]|uniref:lantibiotic dehydratase n=1 Tax=Streptomyces sp. NBC_01216 TaxID=2903778 RepID=UPI002E0F7C2C|nr:lantibiotic dehydratase family protein [Streptomyces sp. NBC_01216]
MTTSIPIHRSHPIQQDAMHDYSTEHTPRLVRIGESEWTLWPTAMVRGAGFPAEAVQRLADVQLAALADAAPETGAPGAEFLRVWDESAERTSGELATVAASDRFQSAVGWQNPRFLDTAVEPFLRQRAAGKPANSKRRTREQTIATYWQRYCLKNETIGFFGPAAWASVGGDDEVLHAEPGPDMVAEGTVHLERWAVDTLARSLAGKFDLRPWLRPRRSPLVGLDGDRVGLADGTSEPVDACSAAVLATANGAMTARQLAQLLIGRADLPLTNEADAFAVFDRLRRKRWLIWRLELPTSLAAEEDLLALLGEIDDEDVRATTVGQVTKLIDGRRRLQAVWAKPTEARHEMDRLEQTFQRLTGADGTRRAGQAYGGRTLAYLECRRDLTVRVGARFTDSMRPITGVLDSIRWLTWRIREQLEPDVRAAYRSAQGRSTSAHGVDAATFWVECMPLLGGRMDAVVREAVAEFHRRWHTVLDHDPDVHQAAYTTAELEPALKEQFDAPEPGWTQARLSCPDVMVAAGSDEDVRQGHYSIVLGEVHAAMNSLDYISIVPSHLDPGVLRAGLDASFPGPRLMPVLPTESRPHFTVRSHPALFRAEDHRLAIMPQTPLPQAEGTILAADAVVRESDCRLVVSIPGHTGQFDVFDLFGETLKALMLRHFSLFPIRRHRPRISVDEVVLAREGWRVPVGDLDFARLPDAGQRFIAARRWAAKLGLPRYVFVKSPVETKPFYVDFAAPVFVDMLASCVRRTARDGTGGETATLTFVEMTPGPDELWLAGGDGRQYTSEFRFAAHDLRARAGGGQ